MLLEVLISLAIIVLAIGTLGSQVSQSLRSAEYTDKLNRALMLAEWVLAELDLPAEEEDKLIELEGEEGEGLFGERYPGFGWRIKRESTDTENLDLITLDILHGAPEDESTEEWEVLHSVYCLLPIVPEVDPTDFGMPSEEEIGLLAAAGATGPDGAPATGDMSELPPDLEEILSALPGPIQDIFRRFMGGEAVPLDEIRAAFGELTTEDLLGLLATPALFGMLSGDMSGLTSQLMGNKAPGGLDQVLNPAQGEMPDPSQLGDEMPDALQDLMSNR